MIKFDMNNYVKVKLNYEGIKVLADYREVNHPRILEDNNNRFAYIDKSDDKGFYKFHLYELANIFGNHLKFGSNNVFEDNAVYFHENNVKNINIDNDSKEIEK